MPNPLVDYFIHFFEDSKLKDLEHDELVPTWRNLRRGKTSISKRLDKFLMPDKLVEEVERFITWVGHGGS